MRRFGDHSDDCDHRTQRHQEAPNGNVTIDPENDTAACTEVRSTVDNLQSFTSEKELAKLTTEWPGSGLAEVWNSFAGMAPFSDLKQEVHGSQVARRTDLGSDPAFVGMDYCRRDAIICARATAG